MRMKQTWLLGMIPAALFADPAWAMKPPILKPKPITEATAKLETIAVMPWIFRDGVDGAVATGKEFLGKVLNRAKLDSVSEVRVRAAWEDANGSTWAPESKGRDRGEDIKLPTPAQLLRAGKKLHTDWVMAGKAVWHTRSIWIGLGPKTKSSCTVDMMIVNVKDSTVALEARHILMDDTAKEDTLKALGAVFVSSLFTVVSGGPKTPHEQRAVQLAMAKAIDPWMSARVRVSKIDSNDK